MELNKYNLNDNNVRYFQTYLQEYINNNYGYSLKAKFVVKIEKVGKNYVITIINYKTKKSYRCLAKFNNYNIEIEKVKNQQHISFDNDILDCYIKFKEMIFGNSFLYDYNKFIINVAYKV